MSALRKSDGAGVPSPPLRGRVYTRASKANNPQNSSSAIVSMPTSDKPIEDLLNKEWLLTNNRGGYASSTIVGCNTRRYHGLLIGSLRPPANRIMALAKCLETVIFKAETPFCGKSQNGNPGEVFNLSTFEFSDKFSPAGFTLLRQFRQDIGVHFDYELAAASAGIDSSQRKRAAGIKLTKSIYLLRDTDTVALVYDFTNIERRAEFVLHPFVGLRDFHKLQKSCAPLYSTWLADELLVRHDMPEGQHFAGSPDSCELFLSCPSANFENDQQWWFNFVYRSDRQRGEGFTEDLWTPGFFKCCIDSPTKIVLWANLQRTQNNEQPNQNFGPRHSTFDIRQAIEDLHRHQESVKCRAESVKPDIKRKRPDPPAGRQATLYQILCLAADQFIATRESSIVNHVSNHEPRIANYEQETAIVAGFPWFADWGRDALVALPGLLLLTGRFDEARSVLTTFAQAADEGMIPNRFDDSGSVAYFNSVDASLWFINAAFQYLNATGDSATFTQQLLPIIRWIVDFYQRGTRFDIHADADGLITAGNPETQLTWMDAKYNGVALTARYGKAVEINALWYNALCLVAEFYDSRDSEIADAYRTEADKVRRSFCKLFWNEPKGWLNDCILPDGSVDDSLRPNQIFAVSLSFSPLSAERQSKVVDVIRKKLLTPYGLRTLNAEDGRYKGRYIGPQNKRDDAYHQGTVWPYLIGPFIEAYLKVHHFSQKSKDEASEFIEPLMQHLTEDGCLGQICEIFDAAAPHKPRGCFAQAWSVAELIRACRLIND